MLQNTLQRLDGIHDCSPPLIVCNEEHRFIVAEQLCQSGIKVASIILEPQGCYTAPAIAVAALTAQQQPPAAGSRCRPCFDVKTF